MKIEFEIDGTRLKRLHAEDALRSIHNAIAEGFGVKEVNLIKVDFL